MDILSNKVIAIIKLSASGGQRSGIWKQKNNKKIKYVTGIIET
jgi:hypothetical protein